MSLHALQKKNKLFDDFSCFGLAWHIDDLHKYDVCFCHGHILFLCTHIDNVRSYNAFSAIQLEILQLICMHQPHFMVLALSKENSSNCYFATLKWQRLVLLAPIVSSKYRDMVSRRQMIESITMAQVLDDTNGSLALQAAQYVQVWKARLKEPVRKKQSSFTEFSQCIGGHDFPACCYWIISGQVNTDQSACYHIMLIVTFIAR